MSIDTTAPDAEMTHATEAEIIGDVAVVVEAPLVAEELLVEEVSIDGMCGVY
ncbi:MAG TPA: mycofactocin precursor MftA [Microthrixaceae bacterium]|jgi:mycofactocin precursor|nr:mycofactocin precursor MftA [Microthrixaceae bacterium]